MAKIGTSRVLEAVWCHATPWLKATGFAILENNDRMTAQARETAQRPREHRALAGTTFITGKEALELAKRIESDRRNRHLAERRRDAGEDEYEVLSPS